MGEQVAEARRFEVRAADGRRLTAYEAGVPDGFPVVVHHGTPGSGVIFSSWDDDARARGIRLLAYSRPGYDGSDRAKGRSVADAASDTAALLDAVSADRAATWGMSGGGPHALACAALLPDRIVAAASVGGVAPFEGEGLDWLAGMGQDNIDEFGAVQAGEQALDDYLQQARAQMLEASPETISAVMASLLPEVDVRALEAGIAVPLHANTLAALADGAAGWFDDDVAFEQPWGFDLATIRVPVLVRQGRHDQMVPFAHGQWLAGHIPGVTPWLSDTDGHLSLLLDTGRTHAWLLEQPDGSHRAAGTATR